MREHDFRALVYGWGNDGMSADHELLAAIMQLARASTGPVLECGSGISTVMLAAMSRANDVEVYSLEHLGYWRDRVQRRVDALGTARVHVVLAPLRDYGGFMWYDLPLAQLPKEFGLVICDGPPGDTPGGRYGLLPVMRDHLLPGATVLLDDVERSGERRVLARWSTEFGATVRVEGDEKPYAIVRIPPRSTPRRPMSPADQPSVAAQTVLPRTKPDRVSEGRL